IEGKVNSIKLGEKSDPLEYSRRDEIGDVFLALNEMEKEINDSREFQIKYEDKRSELLANIAHDLKTPMTAIRGYVDGINDGVANTPEKLKKYTSIISTYVKDMDVLIDDLTLLSNLDTNNNSMKFENVLFKEYIEDCTYELDFEMEEHKISFEYTMNIDESSRVIMDRDKIKRVINNVVTNAIKFTKKEFREIKLIIEEDSRYISVYVRDNGIGIESEKLENIFDRFYRVDQSRSSNTGGSGLGLSIAKQIIEEHGGIIAARSEFEVYTEIYFKLKKV
ncbi:MAG: HAMP domain-containing sensor histidine kinase, partial [Acidaminobacteraceae bacterium]